LIHGREVSEVTEFIESAQVFLGEAPPSGARG
jgi:hypothetical protein